MLRDGIDYAEFVRRGGSSVGSDDLLGLVPVKVGAYLIFARNSVSC